MLDTDARVAAVNGRVARLRQRRQRRVNVMLSVSCAMLCLGLIGAIGFVSGESAPVTVDGLFGSSSLLGSDVGGYVLVALVSFSLAVAITLLCLRRNRTGRGAPKDDCASHDERRKGAGQ